MQRKLRWVEIGLNRQVLLYCLGGGHSFQIFYGPHHCGNVGKNWRGDADGEAYQFAKYGISANRSLGT